MMSRMSFDESETVTCSFIQAKMGRFATLADFFAEHPPAHVLRYCTAELADNFGMHEQLDMGASGT